MSEYIVPGLHSNQFPAIIIVKLLLPFTIAYMIIFYLLFDIICNGIAEITRFGEREFYQVKNNKLKKKKELN